MKDLKHAVFLAYNALVLADAAFASAAGDSQRPDATQAEHDKANAAYLASRAADEAYTAAFTALAESIR